MGQMFPYLLFQLHNETSKVIRKVLDGYPGNNSSMEQAWDFIQRNVSLHTLQLYGFILMARNNKLKQLICINSEN